MSRISRIKIQQGVVFSRIVQCVEGASSSENPEKSTVRWLEDVPKETCICEMHSEGARVVVRIGRSCECGRPLDVVEVRASRPDILLIEKEVGHKFRYIYRKTVKGEEIFNVISELLCREGDRNTRDHHCGGVNVPDRRQP
jgi:hypothetical protein